MCLNSWGVNKYESNDGKIKLVVTHANKGDTKNAMIFDNEESYEQWIDGIVTEDDWHYNKARGLSAVLNAMQTN